MLQLLLTKNFNLITFILLYLNVSLNMRREEIRRASLHEKLFPEIRAAGPFPKVREFAKLAARRFRRKDRPPGASLAKLLHVLRPVCALKPLEGN